MICPPFLLPAQTAGIVAMACKLDPEQLETGIRILENWGLKVVLGHSVYASYNQFAGDDQSRAASLQQMLNDPGIRVIFSARGGYGSTRMIDDIDFSAFLKNPKWVVGFSDITAVHAHLHTLGVESLHATMPKLFGNVGAETSVETLRQLLFGESLSYQIPAEAQNRLGVAKGQLIGGNLCLLAHLIGSPSDMDYAGKILFLEDVNEYLYNIDRLMIQLKRAGKLKHLAGLIVGQFSDNQDNDVPFGLNPNEIVAEHCRAYAFPIAHNFPVGHTANNWAMPCGREVILAVENHKVTLRESVGIHQ